MYKIIGNDQNVYGPVGADELRQWIREGRANGQSRIQAEGSTEWRPLQNFPEFTAALNERAATAVPPVFLAASPRFPTRKNNGMAVAGFVLSLLSLPCCGLGVFSLLGLVFSIIALVELRRDPLQPGKGLAVAGLIISLLSLLLALLFWGLLTGGILENSDQLFSGFI